MKTITLLMSNDLVDTSELLMDYSYGFKRPRVECGSNFDVSIPECFDTDIMRDLLYGDSFVLDKGDQNFDLILMIVEYFHAWGCNDGVNIHGNVVYKYRKFTKHYDYCYTR